MIYSKMCLLIKKIFCAFCLFVFIKRGCAEKVEKGESGEEVKIVAVDLQAMAPLPRVTQIQGDITKVGT